MITLKYGIEGKRTQDTRYSTIKEKKEEMKLAHADAQNGCIEQEMGFDISKKLQYCHLLQKTTEAL